MRFVPFAFAAPLALLAACGGPEASQANNTHANIGSDAHPENTALATAVTNTPATVSGDEAKRVMHERHEGMEAVGKTTKAIKRQLDSASPDLGTIRTSAGRMAELAEKASGWFPAGTGPNVGKTAAKPEIWQNYTDFSAKMSDFQKAAQALNRDASGSDVAAIKARFADLGGTCKACHDKYRKEMKH
jgi:cytochrome c556